MFGTLAAALEKRNEGGGPLDSSHVWFRRQVDTTEKYYITKLLRGHGNFRVYLHKIGKADTP